LRVTEEVICTTQNDKIFTKNPKKPHTKNTGSLSIKEDRSWARVKYLNSKKKKANIIKNDEAGVKKYRVSNTVKLTFSPFSPLSLFDVNKNSLKMSFITSANSATNTIKTPTTVQCFGRERKEKKRKKE